MAQLATNAMRNVALHNVSSNSSINTPPEEDFNTPAMEGSIQQYLAENLGAYVVIEFLVGTQTMEQKEGILYSVGRSAMVIYEELTRTFVLCDIFAVKFVTFYQPGQRPRRTPMAYLSQESPVSIPPADMLEPGPSCSGGGCGYGYRNTLGAF